MAKQLNVNMSIQADTTQAKKALSDLNKTLDNILSHRTITVEDQSIQQAKQAALDLKHHLDAAVNVNTGKLDLSKFSASLNKSGQNLQGLYTNLSKIGPEGQSAFLSLSQSIAKADASAITLGGRLGNLMTVLKNTARWQLSSSILHGFMGSIQGAYRYAQDLNESLNNIRIVTGQNIDQMASFAREANSAAKALSTTTTEYTNASLIYYQQGLSDEEVKARTDATIKLANVSRQSAEEVSDQMTAVWNNFAEGSDNLEYYIDVMAKLGATTASSTQEISTGLEKFAAVAKTVGLSYEYATAALATVTAKTRQSADVVGTAFKTLFARLQDLELGDTLEDGTTLGKYSVALNAVGVNIKDINGEVKDMDVILDELGSKWNTIAKDQQIALAQTVAGTRQYTQLIALMDNWDFMQENLDTVANAEGTLQEQADIYAESWEAARDRVRAAAEDIYSQLLNDNAFIDILNGFEKVLDFISNIIDGLGGLKGILLLIGSIFMQQYSKEMPAFLAKMTNNLQILTGEAEKQRQSMLSNLTNIVSEMGPGSNRELNAKIEVMSKISNMYNELAQKRKTLSSAEIEAYEQRIKDVESYGEIYQAINREVDLLEKEILLKKRSMIENINQSEVAGAYRSAVGADDILHNLGNNLASAEAEARFTQRRYKGSLNNGSVSDEELEKRKQAAQAAVEEVQRLEQEINNFKQSLNSVNNTTGLFKELKTSAGQLGQLQNVFSTIEQKTEIWNRELNLNKNNVKNVKEELKGYLQVLKDADVNVDDLSKKLDTLGDNDVDGLRNIIDGVSNLESMDPVLSKLEDKVENLRTTLRTLLPENKFSDADINNMIEGFKKLGIIIPQATKAKQDFDNQNNQGIKHTMGTSEAIMQLGSSMMQLSMVWNSLKNIGNIIDNKDLSSGEKMIQIMTSLGMVLTTLVSLHKTLSLAKLKEMGISIKQSMVETGYIVLQKIKGQVITENIAKDYAKAASGWAALGPALLFVGIAAAIIGSLYAIYKVIDLLVNAETEEEAALRKANEAMEEAKQAAEDTKSAYESLKNAVSNYDDAVDALEKCTKGTQEWRDAFQEVLDKTYELIQTYPQLLKYENLFNSDGTLNQDKLQEAVTDAAAAANAAQIRLTRAQTQVQLAQTDLERSNLNESVKSDVGYGSYYTSRYNSQDMRGSAYGGQENQNQTITAQDLADQVLNALQSSDVNYADPEAIKQFVREQIAGQIAESDLDEAVENISNAIIPLSDQFKELANESKGTALALNNASKLIANSFFGEKLQQDPTKELAYTQALNAFNEKLQTETYSKGLDYIGKHHTGTNDNYVNMMRDSGGKIVAEAMEAYIEAAAKEGWTLSKDNMIEWDDMGLFDNLLTGHEKGNEEYLVFKDESGNPQRVRADLVMDTAREYELQKHKDEIIANGNKIYEQQNYNEAILKYLTDMNYNGAKIGEVQNLKISEQGLENIIGNDDEIREFLANKWGMDEISDTMLNDFKLGYQEQMDVALAELDKIPKFIQDRMGNELINSLNVDAVAKVGDMYTKALANGGESGINLLNNIVEKSGDSADEVMTALSEMDITSMSAEEVNEALKKLNINFELTENQVYVLGKILSDTSKVTVEEAQKTYKEISSILSNLKQEGDTIEQEVYDKLLKLNPALSSYFTMMADGTYMLTGAAEDFRRAVQSSQIEQMRQAQRNQAETAMAYTSLQGENFNQITEAKDKINQIVNQTVAEVAKNADKVIGLGFRTREEMTKFAINKGEINEEDFWNTYGSTTNAQLKILKDNGIDTKNWQAQIEAGENLVDVIFDVNDAYNDWNKSIDENDFAKKASEASAEVVKLNEAIKMAQYQNDLTNTGLDYETTENYAKILQEVSEEEDFNIDKARQLAIANQRLDRGLSSLNDNFENWAKSLKKTGKNTAEYSETVKDIRESFADMLNISSGDNLSIEWIEGLMEDSERMKKILAGDQKALEQFRQEALDQLIDNSDIDNGLQNILSTISQLEEVNPNVEWVDNLKQYIGDAQLSADGLKDAMRNLGEGATLSPEYTAALNAMLASGQMTEQQLNDIFASIGYKPKVTTETVEQDTSIPVYTTYETMRQRTSAPQTIIKPDGNSEIIDVPLYEKTSWTEQTGIKNVTQSVPVVQIEGDSNGAGKIDIVNARAQRITPSHGTTSGGKSGGGGSGGGGKAKEPTKKETKNPTDEKDRYHIIKEQLDDLSQAYDRVNKAKDRAFGANKLAGIKAEQKILKEQIDAQDEYLRQIKEMGKYDVNNLQHGKEKGFAMDGEWYATGGLSYYGLEAQFDENGVLTNYDQIVEAAVAKYNEAVAYYNGLTGEQQENDKSLEFAEKQYSSFMDLLKQYEETNNLFQDETDKRQELINQWQDNNYEALSYEIELKLKINEDELKWLEYQLKKIGDDVYKTSEAIANLFSLEGSSQASVAVQAMDDLLTHMNKLDEAYAKGEISEADYFAALEETKDGMYEQLEAMMAIDEQMEEYYANTLSKITEELDKFTDSMRHNIDVVNHMKDILELSGRGQDYEAIGSLLNANMSQTGDIYEASKERYDMLVRQEEEAQAKLEEALRTGGKEEQEIAQKNLDAIIAARQEAENTMYEDWKAHLEACNAVLENELNRTKKVWDDIYTDGQGWEYLEQVMDLAQRIGDKYLTKTNQLYETNKMLRTIQQDMDKTTNKAAQQRLNNFAKEIQNLQQIGELSKDNLEIAKAQYEVLKAEIALEEAQNAKSTVRLQRDNEGNYGYVYTADQDKVEDARQQLEDRRNDLYNLALEQENKNAQDILQINKEKNEALDALNRQYYIDKTITEEEYNQRSQEIQQKYNNLLLAATKDHLIARTILNQESITGENDSWTAEYADLVNKGYAYIDDQNEFWNLGFGAITNNRQQWFSTEGPEWDAFYNNIMNGANQTQIAWNNELATMQNNTKPAIEAFNTAVGVDEQSGVRGTLLNLQTKLKDVTTATSDYKEQLVGDDGLIKNLGEEASKVQESTMQWGKYYDKLKGQGGVISAVEEAIIKIKELIKVASTNASATYTTTYVRVGSPEPDMKDQSATYTTNYVSNGSPSGGGGSGGGSISSGNSQKTWQKNVYKQKNSSYHDVYNHYTDGSETFAYTEPHSFNGKECTKCKYKKSGGSGCFEGDTKIILEDYSEKMIKDIKIGDKVLAYNEEKHYFEAQPVLDIFIKRNNNHTVNVNLSNGITLKMTAGHPILTTSGWKSRDLEESLLEHGMNVNYLNIGDIVLGFGISGRVESITDNYYEKNNNIVYTLKVDICHTFIANNIIVHNSKVAAPFASGGYTGEWVGGSQLDNGKLAILHQKELVLNEDDTKNMLQTVSLVRELSNTIGLRAAASSVATGLSSAFAFDNAQTLEQSVTIHAEFPNAVNHNEIEEAFNTLINRASQFAGRSTF